jgi:hypothetical protein
MKLNSFCAFFLLLFFSINCFSQDTIREKPVENLPEIENLPEYEQKPLVLRTVAGFKPVVDPKPTPETLKVAGETASKVPVIIDSHWKNKNTVGFDLNQIAFVNWNAGGTSSVSGLFKGTFTRERSDINSEWLNELSVRYGLNKQDGLDMRKSDDEFRLNSTFGYRRDTFSNWYFSSKFNFKTQFSNGYKYPNTDNPISKPFAPAYTFLGIGADYFNKEKNLDIYISPVTLKNTLVLDDDLANSGAFGMTKATYDAAGNMLTPGEKSRSEIGFLVTNYYKKEVLKNITMENRLSLYTDYINNFGNIDVEWRLQFDLIVNKYVKANIGMHLIYDDDVKTIEEVNGQKVETAAKVQFKESLGIGMVYSF